MGDAEKVRENLAFLPVKQSNVIAWKLNGEAVGDTWKEIIIILNSNVKAIKQAIPAGTYTVVCANGKADGNGLSQVKGKTVSVPAQSAVIMYR